MRIAITALSGTSYGGVTYFRNIIPALAKVDKINHYFVFLSDFMKDALGVNQKNFHFIRCAPPSQHSVIRFVWEQFILPTHIIRLDIDVLFTAKNSNIYFASVKTVIAVRNMEPLCFNQYKNDRMLDFFSFLRQVMTRFSFCKAVKIVCVSQYTRDFLVGRFPHIRHKMHVVYNGNPVRTETRSLLSGSSSEGKFLFSSSKFVAYANQANLLRGYGLLRKEITDLPPLWLAGGIHDRSYFRKVQDIIREMHLSDKVRILGMVPHDDLLALYSNALAFIFPSTLEACPQTLIEAMACGVPIASSNVGPMPEICDQAAIYFNPYDPQDIAEKIRMIINNPSLRHRLQITSIERSSFFDWEKTAVKTIDVLEKAYNFVR